MRPIDQMRPVDDRIERSPAPGRGLGVMQDRICGNEDSRPILPSPPAEIDVVPEDWQRRVKPVE